LVLSGEDWMIEFTSGFPSPLGIVGAGVDATEHVEDDGFGGVALGGSRRVVLPHRRHAPFPMRPHLAAQTIWEEVASEF
jgi:hypothetical protein